MDIDLASYPYAAALLAAFGYAIRSIADALSKRSAAALVDAETAKMEAETAHLEAETRRIEASNAAAHEEREASARASLEVRVTELSEKLEEQARLATIEIHEANAAHATTLGKLQQLAEDAQVERIRCDRALASLREEMRARISEITSGHSTPASARRNT